MAVKAHRKGTCKVHRHGGIFCISCLAKFVLIKLDNIITAQLGLVRDCFRGADHVKGIAGGWEGRFPTYGHISIVTAYWSRRCVPRITGRGLIVISTAHNGLTSERG